MQIIINQGSRAVVIYSNTEAGPFSARVWVNCTTTQGNVSLGDATLVARKFARMDSAKKWANQQLAT